MPTYDFYCPDCNVEWEEFTRLMGISLCKQCGEVGNRLISRPAVHPDLEPYDDNGLGVRVEGRAHRRKLMRANSLVEYDAKSSRERAKARGTLFSFPSGALRK